MIVSTLELSPSRNAFDTLTAIPLPAEKIVLHVGCGPKNPAALHSTFHEPGWSEVRLDIDPQVAPDILASITDLSAIHSDSVDAVWSSHNLEHLYPHEVPRALSEFLRVLKPGGFALITLPDLQAVAEWVAADKLDDVAYVAPCGPVAPLDMIFGFTPFVAHNLYMAHHCGFTAKTLQKALFEAGFGRVQVTRDNFALWAGAKKI